MPPLKSYQTAVLTGGVVLTVGLLLYYLFKEERQRKTKKQQPERSSDQNAVVTKFSIDKATQEDTLKILQSIIASQEQMKDMIRELTAQFSKKDFTFDELYKTVCKVIPDDPLEKYAQRTGSMRFVRMGLSMSEFDILLGKYDHDPTINSLVDKIMVPLGPDVMSEKVNSTTTEQMIEIHQFMVATLRQLGNEFKTFPNCKSYDLKSVTIVVQIISAINVEKKFGLTMDEVEAATMKHHLDLLSSDAFTTATCEMQMIMGEIVGS